MLCAIVTKDGERVSIMKQICSMAGIIDVEHPKQGINDLKTAGFEQVLLDFGEFLPIEKLISDSINRESWPRQKKQIYQKMVEELRKQQLVPIIAKVPFLSPSVKKQGIDKFILQVNLECIKACEESGCKSIIVQPLFANVVYGKEWEVNREFYKMLATQCLDKGTQILLTNQCRNRGGHLVRGICTDGVVAAEWVDQLNHEVGMERFGFCLDVGICNLCGQDIQSVTKILESRIKAVILTENDGKNMAKLLPFTSAYKRHSTMDWLSVIRGLRYIGFDEYLVLETADTTASFSPLLRPHLMPIYKRLLDYFSMQINIENGLRKYKKIVLFGAGNMCRNYMKCYGEKYPPLFTCDNNEKLWGTTFEGLEVKPPKALKNLNSDCCVIICNIYYSEIEIQLREMGVENIEYFNDEYMPSFYYDRLERTSEHDGHRSTDQKRNK